MLRAPATDGAAIGHSRAAPRRWAGSKGKSVKRLSPPDPSRFPQRFTLVARTHTPAPQTRQTGVRPPTRTHQQQHQIKNPRHHPRPQRGRVWDHPLSKGAATTSSKTTAKNETSQPTDHYAIEYFSLYWIGALVLIRGGTTPTAHPPVRPSGNGISRESGDARFSLKGGNRLCQHADRYRTVWYHQPVSTRPSLGEVR